MKNIERELKNQTLLSKDKGEIDMLLEILRDGTPHFESFIDRLFSYLERTGLDLADVGSSGYEIADFWHKGCYLKAQNCLSALESGTSMHQAFFADLEDAMAKGGLSLDDLGTSEKKLEQYRVRGCKAEATRWLLSIRAGIPSLTRYNQCLSNLMAAIEEGNLQLAHIGTTEFELAILRPKK